MINRYVYNMTL